MTFTQYPLYQNWSFGKCGFSFNNTWFPAKSICEIDNIHKLIYLVNSVIMNNDIDFGTNMYFGRNKYLPNDEAFKETNEFINMTKITFHWKNIDIDKFRICCKNILYAFIGFEEDKVKKIFDKIYIIEIRSSKKNVTSYDLRFWINKNLKVEEIKEVVNNLLNCEELEEIYNVSLIDNLEVSFMRDFDPKKRPIRNTNIYNRNFKKIDI